MSKRGRITVDDLPDEVKEILRGEAHRGQRNTFVIRLGIAIVGLINAFAVAGSNAAATQRIGVFAGLAALAFAIVGLLLARRPAYPFWFKYIGVTVDASVVSMASIASLYSPSGAYEVLLFPTAPILYMMFNMLTALQFSVRLSLFAAVMAGLHRSLLFGYCVQQKLVVLSPTSVYGTRALATDDQLTTILFIFVSGVIAAWVSHTARRLLLQSAEATVRKRKLEQTQDVYRRYLSPHVRDFAVRHPEAMHMGGARRVGSVLTTQIRDFDKIADQLTPERVVEILNEHCAGLVEIVFRHGGTLDKFTGSGVSAIFGIPTDLPDAAGSAVRAAFEMHQAVAAWNKQHATSWPALRIGIGIAEGLVVVGNIGSSERMEYTVIGKAMNLSRRLRAACLRLGADILINAPVHDAIRGLYRADRLTRDAVDAMEMDSAVYRIDVAAALANAPSGGVATLSKTS
jgi:adenylate cyclase